MQNSIERKQWYIERQTKMIIRHTKPEDIPALSTVLDNTELFPSDMLPDMIGSFLSDEQKSDLWLTCILDGIAIGFCYAVPEQLTEGTWNMLAIAVLPNKQGTGAGSAIVKELEANLQKSGNRVLIADTSGVDEFKQTREFYRKNGYTEEARIRDFWNEGDDKIIFRKSLK